MKGPVGIKVTRDSRHREIVNLDRGFLQSRTTLSVSQYSLNDVSELHEIRRSMDFKSLKL